MFEYSNRSSGPIERAFLLKRSSYSKPTSNVAELQKLISREAGGVGEQTAERHVSSRRAVGERHPPNEVRYRSVEIEPLLFDERERGERGEGLRHRLQTEEGRRRHERARPAPPYSARGHERGFTIEDDPDRAAGSP